MHTVSQIVAALVAAAIIALPLPSHAGTAERFLQSMAGSWRGSGTMAISEKSKSSRVRCKITSNLDKTGAKLRNKGQCATTRSKIDVSGSLAYERGGSKVSGSYIGTNADIVVTNSSGSVKGGKLVLFATMFDEKVNKISRSRSVIKRLSAKKFTVTIFERKKGVYQKLGKLTFTK